ncbi:ABC transporter ATP-binding protein [Sulfitobacter sp. M57]|uniref:ABC transporter ATP-binding protein n=1 Tax=unclassified Sulfitobacter TaxID=196795 RepID=UPI0023E1EC14|nr:MULTISPECIES: ABC transporter ATP-binding protein [unclassified Sulfitobacter]MDF3413750.1 ABC transporter ATP-binding protein [Sulfitobacter sp. KE5]MDF3420969.1 ABC transporter ATP-binding protein [Sulfitobacter sp. KE43]MDF3432296.1 ABC transporter ATP-binding protein [Sulfitobacter sp. KE42]MDF3457935.1 ABC transporter ATP-binding protein [Sulfitobacter sp. S74]MDF3461836.1 ABC transporter ATP-binding protein [Sulfitobacter sp. Ks18]
MNILETKGLTKVYGGITANADIDFALPRGKITALIGPNGAGKSTFVGMVSGRTPATRGQVLFEGRDISTLPAHERIQLGIAYTFQITSIFPRLTVYENVAIAARRLFGKDPALLQTKITRALEKVDIAVHAEQIAGDLSYGHQRLLEIAMGLVQEPRVFILDEPTQGLAEAEVTGFIELIKSLAGDATILLIEHNMTVVMGAADWITVLDQGMVLANGTPEDIGSNAAVQAAYLGKTDA